MKVCYFIIGCLLALNINAQSNDHSNKILTSTANTTTESINWMSWDEAHEANKKEPRKIFIDIYTEWCGWCKKMDKTTFQDPTVIKELNSNFYAVKFDAEQKETITFNGHDFIFVSGGRRGVHQLAYALLDSRLGYPAFVTLDEDFARILLSPGYKQVNELMNELQYSSSNAYKTKNLKDYK